MKVYVVTYEEYKEFEVLGVYSEREKAIESLNKRYHFEREEFDIYKKELKKDGSVIIFDVYIIYEKEIDE